MITLERGAIERLVREALTSRLPSPSRKGEGAIPKRTKSNSTVAPNLRSAASRMAEAASGFS